MIKPIGKRILFEPEAPQEKIGSLFIPKSNQSTGQIGRVKAIGEGVTGVTIGERVFIRKHAVGEDVIADNKPHKIIMFEDVLAIV